jgi:uncharacterized protein YkwD
VLDRIPPRVRSALLVLLAFPAADATAATGAQSCPPGATDRSSVVCEINAARAAAGAGRVQWRPSLAEAAAAQAGDMVARRYFAHESPDGDGPAARVRRAGYLRHAARWRVGEIMIWKRGTPLTASAAVAAWLASPSHRRIMLRRGYEDVGAGSVPAAPLGDPGSAPATTLVVVFGRRAG